MNPNNTAFLTAIYSESVQPAIIEDNGQGVTLIGYASPECTGESDPRWLIKRIYEKTDEQNVNIQRIEYAEGTKAYNKIWKDRYSYEYKVNSKFISTEAEELKKITLYEHLLFSGNDFIFLKKIFPTNTTRLEIKFKAYTSAGEIEAQFGVSGIENSHAVLYTENTDFYLDFRTNEEATVASGRIGGSEGSGNIPFQSGQINTAVLDAATGIIKMNGTAYPVGNVANIKGDEIYIGYNKTESGLQYFFGELYEVKIYEADTLVHHLVPATDYNNVVCLLDKKTSARYQCTFDKVQAINPID